MGLIEVDSREGSRELIPLLTAYSSGKGVQIKSTTLEFADFAFNGKGPHGKCRVGIERKRLQDLINSMRTGRLSGHQLPGLLESYDYIWLLVEGIFRGNPETGILEEAKYKSWRPVSIGKTRFMLAEVENFLTSIAVQTPVKIKTCDTIHSTALAILNMYSWWNKDWRAHKSCKVIYDPFPARALMLKPSIVQKVANQLPGVGWEKSGAVDTYFDSVFDMCTATPQDWQRLPGIGDVLSGRIVQLLNGEIKESDL